MKLKSLNRLLGFLFLCVFVSPLNAEEEIDIWNKEKKKIIITNEEKKDDPNSAISSEILKDNKINNNITIESNITVIPEEKKLFGIYEPANYGFNLDMWSKTDAEKVRSSFSRIKKIKLSNTASNLLEKTIFSFAYPPKNMKIEEFIDFKINWMIDNNRLDLIEQTLKNNETFYNKKKIVQYLVDVNIAKANLKIGCEKVNFIDKNIKDPYLEKFKIYCLIFNDKKNEAQLLYDILKEQKKSDKFFDDKINFLLGISNKTTNKINDANLLNFYLSSITIENFQYEPNKNTKKVIWEYLDAANLIKVENLNDKEKIKKLEIAANENQLDKKKIFKIYQKIDFGLNSLINAEDNFQTLEGSDARALIYQKYLLSDNNENKIKLLLILEELFKKDNLENVYSQFLIDSLKKIKLDDLTENYKKIVEKKIIEEKEFVLGKIKYDDKVLHKSRLLKFYTEKQSLKKTQKDFDKIFKKIKRNKKYFYSAKDIAFIESISFDGIKIPSDFKILDLSKEYDVPSGLFNLAKNNESAFLSLKIVEIIGEDEASELDAETIYFIVHLLNKTNLKTLRNEILITALPQRT